MDVTGSRMTGAGLTGSGVTGVALTGVEISAVLLIISRKADVDSTDSKNNWD